MKRSVVVIQALFLAAMLSVPGFARAQITTVTVRVDGLSCPFCAYGLEKKIKVVDGTKEPTINIEDGIVTLLPVGDASVDFDGLLEAVRQAGFTPREIRVEGIGRVVTIDKRPILVAEDGRQLFFLASNDVLTSTQSSAAQVVKFSGTVAPRTDDDARPLRTLVLHSATPREKEHLD